MALRRRMFIITLCLVALLHLTPIVLAGPIARPASDGAPTPARRFAAADMLPAITSAPEMMDMNHYNHIGKRQNTQYGPWNTVG